MPNFRLGDPPAPHYTPDTLGGLCRECGRALPAALAGAVDTHPTCDPDWPPMLKASRRAFKLRKAAAAETMGG